jgi:hypothetical protein
MRFLKQLMRVVRNWWLRDRIRTSSVEGQLLALTTPCLVEVDGESAVLREHETHHERDVHTVIFRGVSTIDGAPCELRCTYASDRAAWTVRGRSINIPPREVIVFPFPASLNRVKVDAFSTSLES